MPVGTTLEEAQAILHKHRVEKLLVVDDQYYLKGLITVKDIQKKLKYPNAAKDEQGRLRVGAALGATRRLPRTRKARWLTRKVDVLVIDTAHGHSQRVLDAVKHLKNELPDVQLIAGNVATYEGAQDLIEPRRRWRQGRHRTGLDLHDTRGQRRRCSADHRDHRVCEGDARHRRSADLRWRHQVLRRCHESDRGRRRLRDDRQPVRRNGRKPRRDDPVSGPDVQELSRNGFAGRDGSGSSDRYSQDPNSKMVPEGIEGRVPYKGVLADLVFQLVGGLRSGMGYTGCATIPELQEKARFLRVSAGGLARKPRP